MDKQEMLNRHIIEKAAMEAVAQVSTAPHPEERAIKKARLLLNSLLSQGEINALNEQLFEARNVYAECEILENWYTQVEARTRLLEADKRVRENYRNGKLLHWAIWERAKAEREALALGLTIKNGWFSGNVIEVTL